MNIVLWVVAGLLAAVFLGAGLMKVSQPKPKLAKAGMGWVDDVSVGTLRFIGTVEILAAIGLILPAALHIAPVLVPLAAVGIVLVMIGAVAMHARRGEFPLVAGNVLLLVLAALVVWGRFGPYTFAR
jgi:uncharacterized membrane protein YphA (DoxX/SURF4 family)